MKIIKNQGIYFTEEEYNKIVKDNQGRYFLPFETKQIDEELEKKIIIALQNRETRNAICDKFNLLEKDLNSWMRKKFETIKITDIRQKLVNN